MTYQAHRSASDQNPPGGFPAEAFERLAALEQGHYWFESRNQLIVWAMRHYFPDAQTFLDVGCGAGFVLQALHEAFPKLALSGTDFLPDGLAIARTRVTSATLLQVDARALDAHEAFDVVGCFDVLEHIEQDTLVLQRLYSAVRRGGGALIAVPQHPWLWSDVDDRSLHVRRYRRDELVRLLRCNGFEVVRTTSFVSLLLPILMASRWRKARPDRRDRELRPSASVNGILRSVLTVERLGIRAGLSWPAGGSLFVVARRPAR